MPSKIDFGPQGLPKLLKLVPKITPRKLDSSYCLPKSDSESKMLHKSFLKWLPKKYSPRATTKLTFKSFRYSDATWVQIYMIFITFQRTFDKHHLIFISLHTELNKNLCCFQKTCKTLEKPRERRRPMNVFFCFPRAEQITRSWPRRQGFSQALLY